MDTDASRDGLSAQLHDGLPSQANSEPTMTTSDQDVFWELIEELQVADPRVEEGTIMGGRCARVAGEFLALVDFKASGMVVKLPRARVDKLIAQGIGTPFAPAGKVFREWVSIPQRD